MVRMTVGDLANAASVSRGAIMRYEAEQGTIRLANEQTLQRTLEAAGARFTERGVEPAA
jgi:predicted transcriptional regulator